MFNLYKIEMMKIFKRKSSWILCIALFVLVIGLGIFVYNADNIFASFGGETSTTYDEQGNEISQEKPDEESTPSNWKENLTSSIEDFDKTIKNYESLDEKDKDYFARTEYEMNVRNKAIAEYRLDNNIEPGADNTMWEYTTQSMIIFLNLIAIFIIIVGSATVSSEYTDGTIKSVLIKPYKRWKILLAKFLSSMTYGLILLGVLVVTALLVGGIMFKWEGFNSTHVGAIGGKAFSMPMIAYTLLSVLINSFTVLFIVILAFAVSCLFKSRAAAIGVSLAFLILGANIASVLAMFDITWAKYLPFLNTSPIIYFEGITYLPGMTLPFTLIVASLYMAVFVFFSFFSFNKRDI